ncbi:WYL domain-containing protein, partial [Streptomyces sp. SBT349]|uniref:WYL domain-containing protein n=1 Tax=Streptomyces sp. SBT349 TaxID=1580539 RepID=UPI00066E93DF
PRDTATLRLVAGAAPQLSPTDRRQLAHAIDQKGPVTIAYIAASGAATVRTLSELDLDPPFLYAWCHLRDDERVFALTRIQHTLPG